LVTFSLEYSLDSTVEVRSSARECNGDTAIELLSQSRLAVAEALGQFGNPEERQRLPLETVTKRRSKVSNRVIYKVFFTILVYRRVQ
jgi:hypothetical protein